MSPAGDTLGVLRCRTEGTPAALAALRRIVGADRASDASAARLPHVVEQPVVPTGLARSVGIAPFSALATSPLAGASLGGETAYSSAGGTGWVWRCEYSYTADNPSYHYDYNCYWHPGASAGYQEVLDICSPFTTMQTACMRSGPDFGGPGGEPYIPPEDPEESDRREELDHLMRNIPVCPIAADNRTADEYDRAYCAGAKPTSGDLRYQRLYDALMRIRGRGGDCVTLADKGLELLNSGSGFRVYQNSDTTSFGGAGARPPAQDWLVVNSKYTDQYYDPGHPEAAFNTNTGLQLALTLDQVLAHELDHLQLHNFHTVGFEIPVLDPCGPFGWASWDCIRMPWDPTPVVPPPPVIVYDDYLTKNMLFCGGVDTQRQV